MSPSLTLLVVAALTQADPTPEGLYETLVSADHWRQQAEAVHALGDLGEAGLPLLVRGTHHDSEKVQDWCYRELFKKFADHEQTTQAVLRGLESEHHRIRYSCCFFAGTQKIESAKQKLRELYREDKDLKLTAAKSLAQLGETDVIRTLYWSAGSDYYMPRYQANVGLKALSDRDLIDFSEQTDGYDWAEGAMVSGGREVQFFPRLIEDAEQKAQRYTALAAWSRWLKQEKPELYAVLDPNKEDRPLTLE
jgi:HEAT repeat protein